jgi:transposase
MTRPAEHTESQIAEILREARRTSVNEVATRYNVSEAAIYAWHSKFGQLGAEEIKRLRHLKSQHARRKQLMTCRR